MTAQLFIHVLVGAIGLLALDARSADVAVPSDKNAPSTVAATPDQLKREKGNATSRAQQDRRRFPKDDQADVEQLFQVVKKDWRSKEARESLEKMIAKYPQFNRTGCAMMYVGQMSEGDERVKYLTEATANHGDCYYLNGVQVGAFGRYLLGHTYLNQGRLAEAQKLFDEVRKDYPNAVTPAGDSLVAVMNEEGKSMKATTQPTAE